MTLWSRITGTLYFSLVSKRPSLTSWNAVKLTYRAGSLTWWELPRHLSCVTLSTLFLLSELVFFRHKMGTMTSAGQVTVRMRHDVCKGCDTWWVLRKWQPLSLGQPFEPLRHCWADMLPPPSWRVLPMSWEQSLGKKHHFSIPSRPPLPPGQKAPLQPPG